MGSRAPSPRSGCPSRLLGPGGGCGSPAGGAGQDAGAGALLPRGRAGQAEEDGGRADALSHGQPARLSAGDPGLGLARDDQDGKARLEIQGRAPRGEAQRRSGERGCPGRFGRYVSPAPLLGEAAGLTRLGAGAGGEPRPESDSPVPSRGGAEPPGPPSRPTERGWAEKQPVLRAALCRRGTGAPEFVPRCSHVSLPMALPRSTLLRGVCTRGDKISAENQSE